MTYNVVVIGGGPAGVTAALRARELGATVALIERARMGGTCTNDGCVPTRVLAKAARLMRDTAQFSAYGIHLAQPPEVNFADVIARAQQVVYQIHEKKQLLDHLADVGVTAIDEAGDAHFVDPHTVALADGRQIRGEKFIICAGGRARKLPFPGAEYTLTHSDVWSMTALPRSVAIIGASATGCQLASIFHDFGVYVRLLDIAPRILPPEDEAVAETVTDVFKRRGIEVETGINGVDRVERYGNATRLVYRKNGETITHPTGAVIVAVGWPGNADRLNVAAAGVDSERGYVVTNDYLQTSAPHIYAAGDITGRMMLVQSAGYQAQIAAENAVLGNGTDAQHRLVPHGGFTDPEYGGVGLTEAQAQVDHDVVVATVPYADLDRAVIDGRTDGFFKLIVDRRTHRVLGAHGAGEQAVEVVQLVAAGMAGAITVDGLAAMELAYPTFAAVVGLAAREIVREMGTVAVVPEWRALHKVRGAEWERQETA